MILVNGKYRDQIDITDRGFQYGDGLFETIEVRSGKPVFFDRHLARLSAGCRKLLIPEPDSALLALEAGELCKQSEHAVLKIIVTRGSGGRGYRQPDRLHPTRVLSLHPSPDYPESFRKQGVTLRFCRTRLGLNPSLAGVKHLNRLEQVLARAEWNDPTIQEGIMLDSNDHVIEGTMTNLFCIKDGIVYTPPLSQAGIAGIIRSIIIDLLNEQNSAFSEKSLTQDELLTADEVFVCNSIIGLWPVKQIANTPFQVGDATRRIQLWLENYKNKVLGNEP